MIIPWAAFAFCKTSSLFKIKLLSKLFHAPNPDKVYRDTSIWEISVTGEAIRHQDLVKCVSTTSSNSHVGTSNSMQAQIAIAYSNNSSASIITTRLTDTAYHSRSLTNVFRRDTQISNGRERIGVVVVGSVRITHFMQIRDVGN